MSLYLGPLGQLTELPSPLTEVPVEKPRTGGIHVGLSGATTVDYLGSTGSYEFRWTWLNETAVEYLEALRSRHVPGPLRFVLPGYRHNRLSYSAASVGLGLLDLRGVEHTGGDLYPSRLWPDQAPPAGRGLEWRNAGAGMAVRLDRGNPAPARPGGEALNGSIWLRSTHADDVLLGLNLYGNDGAGGGYLGTPIVGPTVTLTPGTWTRLEVDSPADAGVWGLSPAVQIVAKADPASVLTLAAAQVEPGDAPTGWRLGGAAPVCSVDTKPATWPWAGKSNHTLTLLEL